MPTPDLPTGGLSVGWNPVIVPEYNNQGSPRARVRSADTKAHQRLIYKGNLGPLALSRTPLPQRHQGGHEQDGATGLAEPHRTGGGAASEVGSVVFAAGLWGVFPGQF